MFSQYQYYQLEANLTSEEVHQVLIENTAENTLSIFGPNNEFHGEIGKETFKIKKVLNYKNSFNPTIKGTIKMIDNNKTQIEYQLKLNPFIKIFSIIWLIFAVTFFISSLIIAQPIAIGFSVFILIFGLILLYFIPKIVINTINKTFENLFHTNVMPRK